MFHCSIEALNSLLTSNPCKASISANEPLQQFCICCNSLDKQCRWLLFYNKQLQLLLWAHASPAGTLGYCSVWKSICACLSSPVGQFCITLQHRSLCFTQDAPTGKLAVIDMLHLVWQDMIQSREHVLNHWCSKNFHKGAVTACQHKSRSSTAHNYQVLCRSLPRCPEMPKHLAYMVA